MSVCKGCGGRPHAADGEDPCRGYECPDCAGSGIYEGSITEAVDKMVAVASARQFELIESDLLSIPGVHLEVTVEQALALDLELIYQTAPYFGGRHYRGIAQAGAMLVDHFPEWGPLEGIAA